MHVAPGVGVTPTLAQTVCASVLSWRCTPQDVCNPRRALPRRLGSAWLSRNMSSYRVSRIAASRGGPTSRRRRSSATSFRRASEDASLDLRRVFARSTRGPLPVLSTSIGLALIFVASLSDRGARRIGRRPPQSLRARRSSLLWRWLLPRRSAPGRFRPGEHLRVALSDARYRNRDRSLVLFGPWSGAGRTRLRQLFDSAPSRRRRSWARLRLRAVRLRPYCRSTCGGGSSPTHRPAVGR